MLDLEVVAQPAQAEDRPPVEGMSAWFDASDPVSIQGGLGDRVREWRDKAAGRHVTQSTDASRPFTGSWSQNGRNVLWTHNRTAQIANGTSPGITGAWTGLAALASTATSVQRTAFTSATAGGEAGRLYRTAADLIGLWSGGGFNSSQTWQTRRPRVVGFVYNTTGSLIRVDGRYETTGTTAAGGSPPGLSIFTFYNGTEPWWGWIGELLIYPRVLTASEIQRSEAYLLRKWGLS